MTAPDPISALPETELTAEFERRVEALLTCWQRLYAIYGVPGLVSKDRDRPIAEHRVGKEMGLL